MESKPIETVNSEDAQKSAEIDRAAQLDSLISKIFDERREAFEELAKGPSPNQSSPKEQAENAK